MLGVEGEAVGATKLQPTRA